MTQPARRRAGAELEHLAAAGASPTRAAPCSPAEEAQRLAELAAAFCLFGLDITLAEAPPPSAEKAFQTERAPVAAAANDSPRPARSASRPVIAAPARRGPHIDPRIALGIIPLLDWVMLAAAAEFAARWGAGASLAALSIGQALAYIAAALALKAGLWATESYRVSPARIRPEHGVGGLALGAIFGLIVSNLLAPDARGAGALAAVLPVTAMFMGAVHACLALWIAAAHRAGAFAETVVIVGATEAARRLIARSRKHGDMRVAAIVDDRLARTPARVGGVPVVGDIEALLGWEELPHIDRIIIAVTQKAEARARCIIRRLRAAPNRIDLLLDYDARAVRGRGVSRLSGAAIACVAGRQRQALQALAKRAQDLAVGAFLLAWLALPMLAIALAVKLDSKGPVLFRQRRYGFNNRVFNVWKFRTMTSDGETSKRITRVGAFLRRANLDNLPQLFNVLRGEMSLVGPAAHPVRHKGAGRDMHQMFAEYAHRHRVKPGITGWAQINGASGLRAAPREMRRQLRLDLDYVARANLWFDLRILAGSALRALCLCANASAAAAQQPEIGTARRAAC